VQEVTTMKIKRTTKRALDSIRKSTESYDETIKRLVAQKEDQNLRKLLIEGYTQKAKEDQETVADWDHTSPSIE
jgi:hypothetical protein|tara:strand:+ start:491 stop:712 length:222 start_codon:yes stop_codon:yes gene_type:complete